MLKPTIVEFREELKPKRITIDELQRLLDAAMSECKTVNIEAEWPRGQRTQSDDANALLIGGIYNPHQLQLLKLLISYDDSSYLSCELLSSGQYVRADKGQALERARHFHAQYEDIPSRRAMIGLAFALLELSLVAAAALLSVSEFLRPTSGRITSSDGSIAWPEHSLGHSLFFLLYMFAIAIVLPLPVVVLWIKVLPLHTMVVPEATPWFQKPAVWSAIGGLMIAVVALLTFITKS